MNDTDSGVDAGVDPNTVAPGMFAGLAPWATGTQLLPPLAPALSASSGESANASALRAMPVRIPIEVLRIFIPCLSSVEPHADQTANFCDDNVALRWSVSR